MATEYKLNYAASDVQKAITNALNPDTSLSVSGKLADAKAVGDAIAARKITPEQVTAIVKTYVDENVGEAVADYINNHPNVIENDTEPNDGDIPKVFINGTIPTTKNEVNAELTYISKSTQFHAYIEIKCQGNSSMSYAKKNFTVKLFEDAEHKTKLKRDFYGWGKQSKFVLKANWIDLSHARNVVSARLWSDVVKSRINYAELPEELRTSPNNGAVNGFPVKVYNNGVYQGRYTLNIPKDAWMANMDDDLDNHCILCGENYVSGCFRAAANINESDWTDEVHDTVPASIKTRWNEVISFVMNSTDEDFKANLSQYFYVDSLIDYYLFGLASCGLDAFGKNQIYMTYDGQKWIASMYDMDSTWGLYWNGSRFVATDYGRDEYEDRVSGRSGNLLYMRLEELFGPELKTRWAELKNGALSIENIITRFERFTDLVPAELVKEDYASTTGGGKFTGIPSQTTNNIQQIRAYAIARLAWTDEYVLALADSEEEPDVPDEPEVPAEPELPTEGLLYSLPEITKFDGTNHIDTGVQLFAEDKPFTLTVEWVHTGESEFTSDKYTFVHCMHETYPWPGVCVQYNGMGIRFDVNQGTSKSYNSTLDGISNDNMQTFKVAIVKDSSGNITVARRYNGIGDIFTNTYAHTYVAVTETLLLGCLQSANGSLGRFTKGIMNDCKVYDRALSDEEITAYLNSQSDVPEVPDEPDVPDQPDVPADGVHYVKSISSTGTQYIDTGIILGSTHAIEISYHNPTHSYYESIFGGSPEGICMCSCGNEQEELTVLRQKTTKMPVSVGVDNIVLIDIPNKTIEINGSPWSCDEINFTGTSVDTHTARIFNKIMNDGTPDNFGSWILYYFKVKENGELILDLRPCLDTDGVACLYDNVSGQYFYNQGTGDFEYEENEPDVPIDGLLYSLPAETYFNGTSDYIDTGIKLGETDIDYTMLIDVTPTWGSGNATILTYMHEVSPWPGLCYRSSSGNGGFEIVIQNQFIGRFQSTLQGKVVIGRNTANNTYFAYWLNNGVVSTESIEYAFTASPQNLILGAYETANGSQGRFAEMTLRRFDVYNRVLSEAEITAYLTGTSEIPENANILAQDYAPNGEAFTLYNGVFDLNTQKIVACIDVSTCVNSNEQIFSIGNTETEIAQWSADGLLHTMYTASNKTLNIGANGMNQLDSECAKLTDNVLMLEVSAEGVKANGVLQSNTRGGTDNMTACLNEMKTFTNIAIGSREGATRSNATYKYVYIVDV